MSEPQEQSGETPLDEQALIDMATELVLSMLRSASTDRIDPKRWWDRARTALETGAACADSLSQMVSRMGAKLEIESLSGETASSISFISKNLDDQWPEFRSLCERDALYIVAMARAINDERKAARKEKR